MFFFVKVLVLLNIGHIGFLILPLFSLSLSLSLFFIFQPPLFNQDENAQLLVSNNKTAITVCAFKEFEKDT